MPAKSYRDLDVWRRAMDLVEEIYRLTQQFPKEELYGLTSQIRRAAVSVPANIAEGYGRTHRKAYLNHLSIARGSLMEVETHVQIAVRLQFLHRDQALRAWSLLQDTGKMLNRMISALSPKLEPSSKAKPEPETRDPEPED